MAKPNAPIAAPDQIVVDVSPAKAPVPKAPAATPRKKV